MTLFLIAIFFLVLTVGKPMKTISYQLSNAPPVGDNWTIVPEEADAMTSTDSAENELSLCDFTSEMVINRNSRKTVVFFSLT